jgi:hypothetical protein
MKVSASVKEMIVEEIEECAIEFGWHAEDVAELLARLEEKYEELHYESEDSDDDFEGD